MTPSELLALADRLEKEAHAQLERAKRIRDAVATIERLGEMEPLTSTPDSTINSTMGQQATAISTEETRALARGKGRSKARRQGHKFVLALYDKGMTMTTWAERNDVSLASVAAWVTTSRKGGKRRIPMRYALKIQQEFGLPATVETWPNGITE
jgi:hypothetical protein